MKILILYILTGCTLIIAGDIQSDVEEILKTEFNPIYEFDFCKYEISDNLKLETEKKVQQKFFKDYVYIWKICHADTLKGFAVLDNTYGKSLPITFLVIFASSGQIIRVDIIKYREPYGGAVGSRRWLDQFIRKSSGDSFTVDHDIDSISGATISVNSITRGVHKLALIIEQIIANKIFNCPQTTHSMQPNAK